MNKKKELEKKLNKLLIEYEEAIKEHEDGDTNFLCNIHGNCAAQEDEDGKEDGYVSQCYFCGTDLIIYKGNYYHNSSFNNIEKFKKYYDTYNTHNYEKLVYGEDPRSEEERRVFELKEEIELMIKEIEEISL